MSRSSGSKLPLVTVYHIVQPDKQHRHMHTGVLHYTSEENENGTVKRANKFCTVTEMETESNDYGQTTPETRTQIIESTPITGCISSYFTAGMC